MIDHEELHMALRARLEAIAELPPPADRAWTSVNFVPSPSRPHVESDFVPGGTKLISGPARYGIVESLGLYVVRWYGLTDQGESDIRDGTGAVLAAFPPMYGEALISGQYEIRGDVAPYPSQVVPVGKGKSRCTVTIPWRALSQNTLPAS